MTTVSLARTAPGRQADGGSAFTMYEDYYGLVEKPFSLTPDPRFLYRSETHADAFDLLQYAIRRREGFVAITGDIGTGKTTLCRAILDQLDRRTFTALVLNPFLSEEDLLKRILQDFGVVSRDEMTRGRLAGASKQDLIDTLSDFLISLLPLRASALLVVDEAQNLPLQVLEQIRILSNLETDRDKLLQIVLVGQLNLEARLRTPAMRQLDQRISIRYELKPLTRRETAAYVEHRLAVAGGASAVTFTPRALDLVHRLSGGTPRLINLLCDRALLGGYAERTSRLGPDLIHRAADTLDLRPGGPGWWHRLRHQAAILTAGAVGSALLAAGAAGLASSHGIVGSPRPALTARSAGPSAAGASFVILVGSYADTLEAETVRLALAQLGYRAWRVEANRAGGSRQEVLTGGYKDRQRAWHDAASLRRMPGFGAARVLEEQP